jgi:hypothetical protein
MKVGSFTPLSDIVRKIAQKNKVTSQLKAAHICFLCNTFLQEIFKKQGKRNMARATALKKNCVYITVPSSAMAQEIILRKIDILSFLHQKGYDVTDIKTFIS